MGLITGQIKMGLKSELKGKVNLEMVSQKGRQTRYFYAQT